MVGLGIVVQCAVRVLVRHTSGDEDGLHDVQHAVAYGHQRGEHVLGVEDAASAAIPGPATALALRYREPAFECLPLLLVSSSTMLARGQWTRI